MIESRSSVELVGMLIGPNEAENLWSRYGSLTEIAKAGIDELIRVDGVDPNKAAAVKSMFVLAARWCQERVPEGDLLDSPERVADLFRAESRLSPVERGHVVILNTRRRLIRVEKIADGTLDTMCIHPREVFHPAIACRGSAVILVHNHPSGDPTPSESDIRVTRDLSRAGKLVQIEVLDHIIMGHRNTNHPQDFASLRELGYLS